MTEATEVAVLATPTTLTVTWGIAGEEPVGWLVKYRVKGAAKWTALEPIGPEPREAVIAGLASGTEYEVEVDALGAEEGATAAVSTPEGLGGFRAGTVLTNLGLGMIADRISETPLIYFRSPHWVAMGDGAREVEREASPSDLALSREVETRTPGEETTETTDQPYDTYQVVGTIGATSEHFIDEAGLFDATTGGHMFASATINPENLLNGESITFTWKVQMI